MSKVYSDNTVEMSKVYSEDVKIKNSEDVNQFEERKKSLKCIKRKREEKKNVLKKTFQMLLTFLMLKLYLMMAD